MSTWQYMYEYRNSKGKLVQVYNPTVYTDYDKCDRDLSNACSDIEEQGFSGVQGDIIQLS